MNYAREFQHYKEQSVSTMTQGEMLTLLYDEMIKRLTKARLLAGHQDYEAFEKEVNRASEIVQYLMDSLNLKYSVSINLSRLYNFFLFEFARLLAGRRMEIIAEVIPLVEELRDTFKQADQLARKGG